MLLLEGVRLSQEVTEPLVDVAIEAGVIVSVTPHTSGAYQGAERFAAQGACLLPAAVDVAVALPHHPLDIKNTFSAALMGGVGAMVVPLSKSNALTDMEAVEMLTRRSKEWDLARVYPLASLTKSGLQDEASTLNHLVELSDAGCIGFSSLPGALLHHHDALYRIMQYAATFNYTLWLHPVDVLLSAKGVAHNSAFSAQKGLSEIPEEAETIAIQILLELVRATGARLHLCRLSSHRSVALLRLAKAEGLNVTADVAITHMLLEEHDIGYFNTAMRLAPPLRSKRDQEALSEGVCDGTIDAICSNHIASDIEDKRRPYGDALAGAATIEHFVPLVIDWARTYGVSWQRIIDVIYRNPLQIINSCSNKETNFYQEGVPANFTVLASQGYEIPPTELCGKHNNPFVGREVGHRVCATVIGGRLVYQQG